MHDFFAPVRDFFAPLKCPDRRLDLADVALRRSWIGALLLLVACGGGDNRPNIDGGGCPVAPPTVCPDPPLRYGDVSEIFGRRCVSCHYGAVNGPWPLLTYSHAADWYDIIRSQMIDCTMPPLDSGFTMTTDERIQILTWILCGFME
jgi:hypothetical protein